MANTYVWLEVLAVLERKVSKPAFQTWLQDTKLEITNHVWTIKATNEFAAEWLATRYRQTISSAIQSVCGDEQDVQFSHDDRKEKTAIGVTSMSEQKVTECRLQLMEEEMMAMKKQVHRLEAELTAIKNS